MYMYTYEFVPLCRCLLFDGNNHTLKNLLALLIKNVENKNLCYI